MIRWHNPSTAGASCIGSQRSLAIGQWLRCPSGIDDGSCRMTQPAPPPMISVLRDSHDCVGFLRSASPKGFTAYYAAGQPLGLFQDKRAAVEAITAAST